MILLNLTDGNVFTVDPSYVNPRGASIGYFDADNNWVEQSVRPFKGNTVLLWKTEAARLVAGKSVAVSSVNLVQNPGFEDGLSDWVVSPSGSYASHIDTGFPHTGKACLAHWDKTAYKVSTSQVVTVSQSGTYKLTAWVQCSGGQNDCKLLAINYGDTAKAISIAKTNGYEQIQIEGIVVTAGTCTIAFISDANADNWLHVDDVSFVRQS